MGVSNPSMWKCSEKQPELLLGVVSCPAASGQSAGSPPYHWFPFSLFLLQAEAAWYHVGTGNWPVEPQDG